MPGPGGEPTLFSGPNGIEPIAFRYLQQLRIIIQELMNRLDGTPEIQCQTEFDAQCLIPL